jgi:hypothetical protein
MLLEKNLNIITLNVPYPPDYGGMIDTFHRIRLLNEAGVGIHLHCFSYGRSHSPELELLCRSVKYYPRKKGYLHQVSHLPYIVSTRISHEMVKDLCENEFAILFDGLHTTGIITDPALSRRKKIVRMHNIEHDYYATLARNETNIFRKLFYRAESARLLRYEKVLAYADHILSVSLSDNDYFNNKYANSVLIPSSHPFDKQETMAGSGNYIIFHGDLSVNENSAVAVFLARDVFPHTNCRCVIAGKNPPELLKQVALKSQNIDLVANPDNSEMSKLIREAHINILPVTKMNGLKLKLLYALYSGRHLIVNSEMAKGLVYGGQYHVADSSEDMISTISALMKNPFTPDQIKEREKFLSENFNNKVNAGKLIGLI